MRGMKTKVLRAMAAEDRRRERDEKRDEKREERRRRRLHRNRDRDAMSTAPPGSRVADDSDAVQI
jgi:hypothetical protein